MDKIPRGKKSKTDYIKDKITGVKREVDVSIKGEI